MCRILLTSSLGKVYHGKRKWSHGEKAPPRLSSDAEFWTETRRKISSPTLSLLCWFKSVVCLYTFLGLSSHAPASICSVKCFTCSKSARYNWGNDSQKSVPRPGRSRGFTRPLPVAAMQLHKAGFIGKSVDGDSGELKKQILVGALTAQLSVDRRRLLKQISALLIAFS